MSESGNLGIRHFKHHLQDELRQICHNHRWDYDQMLHRGLALQRWVADLFCRADPGIETDPESAVLSSRDLGADVVLEDPTRQHLRIIQCKASSLGKETKLPPVDETEVNNFFSRHELFMDRAWVRDHGSENAFVLLGDYRERIKSGWNAEFLFVTTLVASDRVREMLRIRNEKYQKDSAPVTCRLLDIGALKDLHNQADSVEEQITDTITIDLPRNQYFVKEEPQRTLVAVVKGNTLRNLYKTHKESLFTHNIRDFLGKGRAINRNMIETAEKTPFDFFYYNNGVSAVCSQFNIAADRLTAKRMQIINGAQTVGALHAANENPDVQILFRLTESDKARFNEQIIRFNNTQNTINSSDFRCNDPIQQWLEGEFSRLKSRGPLPEIRYSRKRSYKRHKGLTVLTLEDMAKIQYAFLFDPTLIYDTPKQLWTFQSEGGKYEQAFGINDEVVDMWLPDRFRAASLAIAFHLRILAATSAEMKEDSELWYLKRLRYHLLAFAGLLIRGAKPSVNVESALHQLSVFDDLWKAFWPNARQTLIFTFESARKEETTLSAFARSPRRWDEMQRSFSRVMKLKPMEPTK